MDLYDKQGKLIGSKRLGDLPQEELLAQIIATNAEPFKIIRLDLSTAQVEDLYLGVSGGVFQIVDVTGGDVSAIVNVKFNRNQVSAIPMRIGDRIITPFREVYLNWTANPGLSAYIGIGIEYENIFRFEKANAQSGVGIANVDNVDSIEGLTVLPTGATSIKARASNLATAALTTIYTVSALKTLYLNDAWLLNSDSSVVSEIIVTDASDVYLYSVLGVATLSANPNGANQNFKPQLVIPTGYKLKIRKRAWVSDTDTTVGYSYASISGWEL